MADVTVASNVAEAAATTALKKKGSPGKTTSPAKGVKATAKTTTTQMKPTHPPTAQMVNAAIRELKEPKGSSLQAIKKYIVATYKVEGEKLAPFIRKYLKNAVTSGTLVQTKGKGASGSFKLPAASKSTASKASATTRSAVQSAKKKKTVKKAAATAKKDVKKQPVAAKKAAAATKASPKKPAAKKAVAKTAAAKATAKASPKPKSLAKTKKTSAAKPKAPKPKKVGASRSAKTAQKK